jgi:hypothetical protein
MSPEQLEVLDMGSDPKALDGRCDIYSLGLTLWKALTGERPFLDEPDTGDLFDKIAGLISIRKRGLPQSTAVTIPGDCPPGLVIVLHRSLEGDRERRFPTAGEMARQLELCLHPKTMELITLRSRGWSAWIRRHPIATMMPIGLAPNLIAAILNIRYNKAAVIDARPDAEATFQMLLWWINLFFFTIGLGAFWWAARPVAAAVHQLARGEPISDQRAQMVRRRNCRLGTIAALAGVICWCCAGFLWPFALDSLVGWLPLAAHLHFLVSLTLCGLIAAVYPYFLVTYLAMHDLMPLLVMASPPDPSELSELHRIERTLVPFLITAVGVPLLGLAALIFIDSQDKTTLRILVVIGLVGCGFAFLLERRIRATIRALRPVYQ